MDVPLALNDIGICNGLKDIKGSPQRLVVRLTLEGFLRY